MSKIKKKNAELKVGILNAASGTVGNIVLQRNGRIRIKREKVKRKISYKG